MIVKRLDDQRKHEVWMVQTKRIYFWSFLLFTTLWNLLQFCFFFTIATKWILLSLAAILVVCFCGFAKQTLYIIELDKSNKKLYFWSQRTIMRCFSCPVPTASGVYIPDITQAILSTGRTFCELRFTMKGNTGEAWSAHAMDTEVIHYILQTVFRVCGDLARDDQPPLMDDYFTLRYYPQDTSRSQSFHAIKCCKLHSSAPFKRTRPFELMLQKQEEGVCLWNRRIKPPEILELFADLRSFDSHCSCRNVLTAVSWFVWTIFVVLMFLFATGLALAMFTFIILTYGWAFGSYHIFQSGYWAYPVVALVYLTYGAFSVFYSKELRITTINHQQVLEVYNQSICASYSQYIPLTQLRYIRINVCYEYPNPFWAEIVFGKNFETCLIRTRDCRTDNRKILRDICETIQAFQECVAKREEFLCCLRLVGDAGERLSCNGSKWPDVLTREVVSFVVILNDVGQNDVAIEVAM